ncbi:ABC transporter ATP-binding protein [bacterium]|nr:ABC transporter ATP-binding protein [bacterium]
MLEAKGLSKKYGNGLVALSNLIFNLSSGKISCLAGPNGSGKTTTLRLLAALLHPTSGTIHYNDVKIDFNDLAYKARVAYLPERCGFYHRFSGKWNLDFYVSLFNVKPDQEELSHYSRLLELEPYLDKPVGVYSFGTKQKLALLRTLALQPAVFLLDEPFNGLDIESQHNAKQILRALRDRNKIILISTHQISAIEDILDDLIIIYKGKKILKMEMAEVRKAIIDDPKLQSITDFYLYHVKGAGNENQ